VTPQIFLPTSFFLLSLSLPPLSSPPEASPVLINKGFFDTFLHGFSFFTISPLFSFCFGFFLLIISSGGQNSVASCVLVTFFTIFFLCYTSPPPSPLKVYGNQIHMRRPLEVVSHFCMLGGRTDPTVLSVPFFFFPLLWG